MNAEFISVHDPRWKRFLADAPHDFYQLPEYVALCATLDGADAVAFYGEDGPSRFLAPLLLRSIPTCLGAKDGWCDCVSPYGYSTPLICPTADALPAFLDAFINAGRQRGMVTAFFRLHPFLHLDAMVLAKFGRIVKHGQTVYVDLRKTSEQLWDETCTNHRRNIRRLERLGFRAVIDRWNLLSDFIAIYYRTMSRVGAREEYHFPREYFSALPSVLGSRLHLCCIVSPDNHIAAAGLFVSTDGTLQYHLGGTADDYLPLAPSKLMFHAMCHWGQQTSHKLLHLGGGVGGADDSLLQFKSGFSTAQSAFYTYRIIVDEDKHDTLLRGAPQKKADLLHPWRNEFFPAYRQ